MNQFPRMLYKQGGPVEIDRSNFSTLIVADQDELDAALADGWSLTPAEAVEVKAAASALATADALTGTPETAGAAGSAPPPAPAAPTRDEMKAKAAELGITIAHNISNAKLAELIEAATKA